MNSYSYATHSDISQKGPSIKYITLFGSMLAPSLYHTSRVLLKCMYVTHLGPPIFSSTCIHTCTYRGFVLVRGVFVRRFVWGFFVWKVLSGVVLSVPPSVRIHPLQQKAKHHFQF